MANTTKFVIATLKSASDIEDRACSHVEEDFTKCIGLYRESDSFGTVGEYCVCKECKDKVTNETGEEKVGCYDCKLIFKRKDTSEWRWYDFYEAQGDVPLIICNECWDKAKHQNRLRKDAADEAEEFGYHDDY